MADTGLQILSKMVCPIVVFWSTTGAFSRSPGAIPCSSGVIIPSSSNRSLDVLSGAPPAVEEAEVLRRESDSVARLDDAMLDDVFVTLPMLRLGPIAHEHLNGLRWDIRHCSTVIQENLTIGQKYSTAPRVMERVSERPSEFLSAAERVSEARSA